jgi:hypothetical protein
LREDFHICSKKPTRSDNEDLPLLTFLWLWLLSPSPPGLLSAIAVGGWAMVLLLLMLPHLMLMQHQQGT